MLTAAEGNKTMTVVLLLRLAVFIVASLLHSGADNTALCQL